MSAKAGQVYFGMAGLYDEWIGPDGLPIKSYTILTCGPNELMGPIHDRMPAILRKEDYDRWLSAEPDPHELLRPFPSEPMRIWPISTRVNSPLNDDEELLK